jgi:hypothetical protein
MVALLCFLLSLFASPFKSKSRLEAENAALRQQLAVLRRKVRGRVQLTNGDRLFLVQLYRWFPSILKAITIIRPEILVSWHRAVSLLKTPKRRESLEIFAPPPYRGGHDHYDFCLHFTALVPFS